MLSKSERIFWLAITVTSVIVTYGVTRALSISDKSAYVPTAPQTTTSDIGQEAQQWFNASLGPVPARFLYTPMTSLDTPRLIYESGIRQGSPWVNYPEQIALYTFRPPPEIEGYAPSAISVYFGNHNGIRNGNLAAVIITDISPAGVGADETRIDFVKVNNRWNIVWAGDRSISLRYP